MKYAIIIEPKIDSQIRLLFDVECSGLFRERNYENTRTFLNIPFLECQSSNYFTQLFLPEIFLYIEAFLLENPAQTVLRSFNMT